MSVSLGASFTSTRLLTFSVPLLPLPPHSTTNLATSSTTLKPFKSTWVFASVPVNPSSTKACAVKPKRVSTKTHKGSWEDPDDGDEYSDCEQGEEEPKTFLASSDPRSNAQYEDDLRKEVEALLGPEERAILEQNETPVFSKISTAKWRPLHTQALSGQIYFMDKLLEQGLDIDAVDKDGFTALHKAVIGKKEPVISHLLRKGANPHVRDQDGATPLHYAVQVGALQTVKLLIKYKVDVNVADNEGWTPLHVAIQSRNRDIAKILLVNGADKTRRTKAGKLPIDLGLCYGKDFKSYELSKLLKLVPADRDT